MSITPPGPPMGPPPSGPPAGPPQQAPVGWIGLTLQGSVMTSSLIPPSVTINGYPIPTKYGENTIPMPPGPARVEVVMQWMRRYGQATLDVQVQPGMVVPVFYAPPFHQFTSGSIGHTRQRKKGLGPFLVLMAVLLLFVIGSLVLSTL